MITIGTRKARRETQLMLLSGFAILSGLTVFAFDVGLAWKASPSAGVESYNIYWTNTAAPNPPAISTNWSQVASVPASQLSVRHNGIPMGTNYWFATAANGFDESGPSEVVSLNVTPDLANPAPPFMLTLTNKASVSIQININQ